MCYILCCVIYGMVVFTHPTDPGMDVLPFLSAENGGKTWGPIQQLLAVVLGMGKSLSGSIPIQRSTSLAPVPCHSHWQSQSTQAGMGLLGQEDPAALSFPNILQFFHLPQIDSVLLPSALFHRSAHL